MRTVTDSYVVTYNEDGSQTTVETYTTYPTTKKEQIASGLGVAAVLAAPIVIMVVAEKLEARRESRRNRKAAKTK